MEQNKSMAAGAAVGGVAGGVVAGPLGAGIGTATGAGVGWVVSRFGDEDGGQSAPGRSDGPDIPDGD